MLMTLILPLPQYVSIITSNIKSLAYLAEFLGYMIIGAMFNIVEIMKNCIFLVIYLIVSCGSSGCG